METVAESFTTPQHRALGSESRATIVRLVRDAPAGLTAADVAAGTGQHLSTTRAHLERLVSAGLLVKARASGGLPGLPGRPAWRYRALAADPVSAPYRALAAALLDHLPRDPAGARETVGRVGREWGRQLAANVPADEDPVRAVTSVLAGLGFDPRRQPAEPGAATVDLHLRTCPFLELVARNPDAICGLHAGVVAGVLESRGVDGQKAVLEPFAAPSACVVRLPLCPEASR